MTRLITMPNQDDNPMLTSNHRSTPTLLGRQTPTLCTTGLLIVLLLGPGPSLRAEASGPDYYAVSGVAEDDVLNIRAEPNAGAEKIGEIPHDGIGLRNLGCQGGPSFTEWEAMNESQREAAGKKRWCRIEYKGIEGWVAGWYLIENPTPSAAE